MTLSPPPPPRARPYVPPPPIHAQARPTSQEIASGIIRAVLTLAAGVTAIVVLTMVGLFCLLLLAGARTAAG